MKVTHKKSGKATAVACDVLVVPIRRPAADGLGRLNELDTALGGLIARGIEDKEITGGVGSVTLLHAPAQGIAARRVLVVGVGEGDVESWRDAAKAAGNRVRDLGAAQAAVLADGVDGEQVTAFIAGFSAGAYRFTRYRSADPESPERPAPALQVVGGGLKASKVRRAGAVAVAVAAARDLANTPSNDMTPDALAARARELAKEHATLSCSVLGPAQITRMKAGALAAVAKGSSEPAAMIVLRHTPSRDTSGEVLGLVGKAVTFDTGGISIKPSSGMQEMKLDMAGGAAVIEAMGLIASQDVSVPVVGVVPAAENMPSGTAVKPGDVVRAMNGKTIEVINTDAEGRLILADALTYAVRKGKATRLVDFATLTGAMVVALGEVYAGIFGGDDEWTDAVRRAGDDTGDLCWPMPLHRRYDPLIRSKVADLSNAASRPYSPGAVYAAQFLREFTDDVPWCHVDIAGTGMIDGAGTGFGVAMMLELSERLADQSV